MNTNNGDLKDERVPVWNPIKTAPKDGIRYEIYVCSGCKKYCQAGFRLNKNPTGCIDGEKRLPFFFQNTFQKEEICPEQY